MNKISFLIMGQKGYEVLKFMIQKHKNLIGTVVSAEDKSIQEDYYDEIKQLCVDNKIPFFNRKQEYSIQTKYAFAIAWRWLLFLEDVKVIIFHDSLLPKYRGFNPLVSCLLNEEKLIGVTALFASEKFDCGDIIDQKSIEIEYPIKLQKAIDKIAQCYVKLVDSIVANIKQNKTIEGCSQNEKEATYSVWRDIEDYRIDWSKDSNYIKRFIDALGFPYNSASSMVNGRLTRISEAQIVEDVKIENRYPGKVLYKENNNPVVICGTGLLKIVSLLDNETREELLPLRKFRTRFN
tara:strand:+ start:11530 stop:12408 length:879 start_codon:yes stop_codon:yes gene_type:complete